MNTYTKPAALPASEQHDALRARLNVQKAISVACNMPWQDAENAAIAAIAALQADGATPPAKAEAALVRHSCETDMLVPAAALLALVEEWVDDGDTIPQPVIDTCRDAIGLEFGISGTDGYYKRILVKVLAQLIPAGAGKEHSDG